MGKIMINNIEYGGGVPLLTSKDIVHNDGVSSNVEDALIKLDNDINDINGSISDINTNVSNNRSLIDNHTNSINTLNSNFSVLSSAVGQIRHLTFPEIEGVGPSGTTREYLKKLWDAHAGDANANRVYMGYNSSGSEYCVILAMSSNGKHGTALKWGYDNLNIFIMRRVSGTWRDNDWQPLIK